MVEITRDMNFSPQQVSHNLHFQPDLQVLQQLSVASDWEVHVLGIT